MELFPIVFEQGGQALTTSREIADYFGKSHKDILRAIRDTQEQLNQTPEGQEFNERNFAPISMTDAMNREKPAYVLTRDGFTLLAMGFTGARAMQFKVAYINAFNRMAAMISASQAAEQRAALGSTTISGETAIFLQAIEQATQNGEYVIVPQHARSWRGKLLGVYVKDQIRLFADVAYSLYTALSREPLSRKALYTALASDGVAEPHRGKKPRSIKGVSKAGVYLYRSSEAVKGIKLMK